MQNRRGLNGWFNGINSSRNQGKDYSTEQSERGANRWGSSAMSKSLQERQTPHCSISDVIDIWQNILQGTEMRGVLSDSMRSGGKNDGGSIEDHCLRQQILKECHDAPFPGHVGMHKTLELVDKQFHYRGLRGDTIQYVKHCPTCQIMKSDNRAKAGYCSC